MRIEMKRRDKWILIWVCLVLGIAPVVYLGYFAIWAMRDLDRMEARRPLLLYETNHQELLKACRELSKQVATGRLEPRSYVIYGHPDPESKQFPQLILDLSPLEVDLSDKNGQVVIMMSSVVMYGAVALPEDYKGPISDWHEYATKWGTELTDGLWYYDEDFREHPEHKKEIEELLDKRKAGSSSAQNKG